jgi:hypothetical protein
MTPRPAAALPPALAAAYRRTDYTAEGGRVVARIGRRSASADALLRRLGARQGGFVTAWNPFSRRMPRGWNERMLARLRARARRLGPIVEGWGQGRDPIPGRRRHTRPPPAGAWAERHLLVAADPRRVLVLGRRFRQNAIVALRAGAPARLLPC